ncbi:MAG TPA: mechanosensitive ion channel domain-containing protein [Dongiaceae bacterium]|nr:mechanosensitive ion channel domain-containing protein [Dongiaceae bacterium]
MPRVRPFPLFALALALAGIASPGMAQIPGAAPSAPASAAVFDPLDRTTPRGTVMGFLRAAQDENYAVAVQYFQPVAGRHKPTPEEDQEVAAELLAVINQRILANALDSLSRDPQGKLDDGLPANQDVVLGVRDAAGVPFSILLIRLDDDHGNKLWYISRKTLEDIPVEFESLKFSDLEKRLPSALTAQRFLTMPLWQWLGVLLGLPLALVLGWTASLIPRVIARYRRRKLDPSGPPAPSLLRIGPGTLLLAALTHYLFVFYLGVNVVYRQYYRRVLWVFLALAFYLFISRLIADFAERIGRRFAASGRMAERSMVSLARRVLEVLIFIALGLILLSGFGVNVTAALAGLGIGGLAIGLGAQKTFENLLGGVSVLSDKSLQIGDACRIGDQRGTVEDIGLRSTKLRTEERTVLTIPNGTVASVVVENFRQRDKILCKQVVRLRYDLSSDHITYVLGEIRGVLQKNSRVESGTARVRLLRFADFGIEVEIYAYILVREFAEFLELQELLLISILEKIEQTGAAIALPSQATLVTQDAWVDPAKAQAEKVKASRSRSDAKEPDGRK